MCVERKKREILVHWESMPVEKEVAWVLGLTEIVCLAKREMLWFSVPGWMDGFLALFCFAFGVL